MWGRSGKDYNKFEDMKLTPGKAKVVKAPIIEESPVSIECRVKEIFLWDRIICLLQRW